MAKISSKSKTPKEPKKGGEKGSGSEGPSLSVIECKEKS